MPRGGGGRGKYKSLKTGKFVSAHYGKRHPGTCIRVPNPVEGEEAEREGGPRLVSSGRNTQVEMRAQPVAMAFHEAYERLAPEYGYETRAQSAVPWAEVPENNRRLMIAVAEDLLKRGVIS